MNVDASNDEKASKNTQLKPKETEPNTNDPDSPYGVLYHMFNPNDLPMEDKHVNETPSNPQTHLESHIDIMWDPSPPTSELGAHDPYDGDTHDKKNESTLN